MKFQMKKKVWPQTINNCIMIIWIAFEDMEQQEVT